MAKPSSTGAFGKCSIYPSMYISEDNSGFQPTPDGEMSLIHYHQQQGNSRFSSTISRNNRSSDIADTDGYDEVKGKFYGKMDVRYVIIADLDVEMMQDALAILQFPKIGISVPADMKQWKYEVPILMNNWARKTIHDPILEPGENSQDLVHKIHKLHQRMLIYIQDYIRKATSRSLPQAYSSLPTISQGEASTSGQRLEEDFDLGKLGNSGRNRLFWAFLRYELMSKIRLYKSVVDRFYIPPLELERRRGKLFRAWETEALLCVRTYSVYLHRAFFAQWPEAELPNVVLPHDSLPARSRLPFQMLYLAIEWAYESDRDMKDWLCVMTRLANFGFGLITQLILAIEARLDYHELSERIRAFADNIKRPCCCDEVHKGLSRNFPKRRIGDEETPGLFREILSYHGSYYTIPMTEAEMYRQRAWPFFNYARAHPQYSAFFPQSIAKANSQQTLMNGKHEDLDPNGQLPTRPEINTPPRMRPGRAIAEFIRSRTEARMNRR
jgi:hypothetical protein